MVPDSLSSLSEVRANLHYSLYCDSPSTMWQSNAQFHIQTSSIILAVISLKVGYPFLLTVLFHWRLPCTIKISMSGILVSKLLITWEVTKPLFSIVSPREQGCHTILAVIVPSRAILPCGYLVTSPTGTGGRKIFMIPVCNFTCFSVPLVCVLAEKPR